VGTVAALSAVVDRQGWTPDSMLVGVPGMGLTFGMWVYYLVPSADVLQRHRDGAPVWGYLQMLIVTSIVATGAGLHLAAYFLECPSSDLSRVAPRAVRLSGSAAPRTRRMAVDHVQRRRDARRGRCVLGVSVAACLVILVLAPATTVVVYEVWGYRHQAALTA
jgi:hypothetical protein